MNLPPCELRVKNTPRGPVVLDPLRKRYVALTPEEWVRQHFTAFLTTQRGFPPELMSNEVSLVQNGIKRRCDTLVADRHGQPLVIVEYKAPNVQISQATFDQIVRYNLVLNAPCLMVSNGVNHYCCKINRQAGTYAFLDHIPTFEELLTEN